MPLNEELRARAEHNERFLATFELSNTLFLDWAVVVAFYTAVRYVDAYFYPDRPVDHPERNAWVASRQRTRPIWLYYRELYNQSREARYELGKFSLIDVQRLVQNNLSRIKTHLLRQP
ncbi:MAG: hypothetical protein HY681_09510 [Chloroflexi bacterium]|nr:hypothetical protein [Chloroflexota bacterium]